jgi:DNA polymerase-3 subunit gamma/tau
LRAPAVAGLSLPASGADAAAGEPPAFQPTPLGDRWSVLVRRLADAGAISALARELAFQGGLVEAGEGAGGVWRLVVERESLRAPALVDRLAAALGAEFGHAVRLEVVPGTPDDSPARRDAAERHRRQVRAEDIIRNDPVVQQLLGRFPGAQVVPGSIRPA